MTPSSPPKPTPKPNSTPPCSALPFSSSGPPYNAWGRFGPSDQLGTLNLLTPAVIAAAARSEIRTGVRVSLDWPLNKPKHPSFGRDGLKHEIRRRGPDGSRRVVNDDVLEFNTQGSSQWDGLRHYGYLKERRYYNNTTDEQLRSSPALGIDVISSSGGITGRGILLDYAYWCSQNDIPLFPLTSTSIPLSHLQSLIADFGVTLSPDGGDILFIRCGFTAAFDALSLEEQKALSERPAPDFLGLEATPSMLRFLWDSNFAAVAGDAPSFERSPVGGGKSDAYRVEEVMLEGGLGSLHEVLLGGWGCPIGEMFDLEGLSGICRAHGRWSFFVSSVPLKVPGGVASPPNGVAIF